jgi:hypothetical protein
MNSSACTKLFKHLLETLVAIGKLQKKTHETATMEAEETLTVILELMLSYIISTRPEAERSKILKQINDHDRELTWLGPYLESIFDEPTVLLSLYQATQDVMDVYFAEVMPNLSEEKKKQMETLLLESFK